MGFYLSRGRAVSLTGARKPPRKPRHEHVAYSDGTEDVWRDRKGRVTRRLVLRTGQRSFDHCYRYVRDDGGVRRVRIAYDEWAAAQEAEARGEADGTKRRTRQPRGNVTGLDENDEDIAG